MKIKILSEVETIKNKIIDARRDLHKYPELGFEVHRTARIIAEKLETFGLDVKTKVGKTGVVGDLFDILPPLTETLRQRLGK